MEGVGNNVRNVDGWRDEVVLAMDLIKAAITVSTGNMIGIHIGNL